jgi:hypothetical protein
LISTNRRKLLLAFFETPRKSRNTIVMRNELEHLTRLAPFIASFADGRPSPRGAAQIVFFLLK